MESVMLMLSQKLMPMLSMDHMESTVLDIALILWDMVMAILATLLLAMAMDMVLAMVPMDMEDLMLSQRLMPMLSTVLMEDMVLDTALIPWDMAMAIMDMESAMLMLSQSLMLSMDRMVGMAMDLDTVHTLWDMDMDMAMVMDMAIMVELSDTTNQARHYNNCNDNALWSKYSSLFSLNIV